MHQAGVTYYLSPADKGGEPPGRWRGAGLAEFGFHDGQTIDREVFERLYGQFLDPRDPGRETRLGRSPQRFRSAGEVYAGLTALEREATAERRAELMTEAKNQVRLPVQYFDVTFSVSKSITLLHASALANAVEAEAARDEAAAAYWHQAAADVWACIEAGNRASGPASRQGTGLPWSTCSVKPGIPGLDITVGRSTALLRAGGKTRMASSSARSRSTPPATATPSCTFITWCSTASSGNATARGAPWIPGGCSSTGVPRSAAAGGNFTTFKPEQERNPAGHHADADRLADLAKAHIAPDALDRLARIANDARRAQQEIDYLRSIPRYAADDHSVYLGTAWEMLARHERDAIIQPPKPEIVPADTVLQRAQERIAEAEPELEAG